jgi:hypothetical protein
MLVSDGVNVVVTTSASHGLAMVHIDSSNGFLDWCLGQELQSGDYY